MSKYDAEASSALADITDAGAAVTFSRGGGQVYDPATDTWSGGSSTPVTGQAIQVKGNPDRFAALSLVLVDPVTLVVAAYGFGISPRPGDTMLWAGVTYTIKDVEPTGPDGAAIVYRITGSR